MTMHFQLRMLPGLPDLSPLRCELRYEPASELPRPGGDCAMPYSCRTAASPS